MTQLTNAQQVFKARAAIKEWMGAYETIDGDTVDSIDVSFSNDDEKAEVDETLAKLGVDQDILDGYRLAVEDLEKARVVMEEHAAFGHLMQELQTQHPATPRSQLQKAARALVADPETRKRAAQASGVYELVGVREVK